MIRRIATVIFNIAAACVFATSDDFETDFNALMQDIGKNGFDSTITSAAVANDPMDFQPHPIVYWPEMTL